MSDVLGGTTVNVLSLFSGIGGIDLGLQRAGMTIVGQVEIDPWCRRVLAKHWPEVPRHDDVATLKDWWYADGQRPYVDLLGGGFPCQPISYAGQGLGTADPRWLWPLMCAAVRGLRPRYVFLENVPGIRTRGLGVVLGDLAACGYDVEWDCIPAAALGAPHRRDRWFAIAYPASVGRGTGRPRGPSVFRSDRPEGQPAQDLADTAGKTARDTFARRLTKAEIQHRPRGRGETLPDPDSPGLHPRKGMGWTGSAPQRDGGWPTEPRVDRVAYGIPRQVDRLRGLGNAVVPIVAEYVGQLIMARE